MAAIDLRPDFSRVAMRALAVHEAGHYFTAQHFGCRIDHCQIYRHVDRWRGSVRYATPDGLPHQEQAMIRLAGGEAEKRFYLPDIVAGRKPRDIRQYWSEADYDPIEAIIAEAEPRQHLQPAWLWEAVAATEKLVKREWPAIKRIAREIIAKNGVLLIESAPVAPPAPKPAPPNVRAKRERLLREAMEHLWGAGEIYP